MVKETIEMIEMITKLRSGASFFSQLILTGINLKGSECESSSGVYIK